VCVCTLVCVSLCVLASTGGGGDGRFGRHVCAPHAVIATSNVHGYNNGMGCDADLSCLLSDHRRRLGPRLALCWVWGGWRIDSPMDAIVSRRRRRLHPLHHPLAVGRPLFPTLAIRHKLVVAQPPKLAAVLVRFEVALLAVLPVCGGACVRVCVRGVVGCELPGGVRAVRPHHSFTHPAPPRPYESSSSFLQNSRSGGTLELAAPMWGGGCVWVWVWVWVW
jgi:hypothetical protein